MSPKRSDPYFKLDDKYINAERPYPISTLMGTSNNFKFVTPVKTEVQSSQSRQRRDWIPAGVYPDEDRGRNDIFKVFL